MDSFSRTCTIISTIVIASRDESKGEVRGMKVGCESWRINRVPWHVHANRNFKTLITETSSPALFQKELLTIRWFRESWFYPSDLRSQWRSIYSQLKQSQLFPPSSLKFVSGNIKIQIRLGRIGKIRRSISVWWELIFPRYVNQPWLT